jgi:hypothetical protein
MFSRRNNSIEHCDHQYPSHSAQHRKMGGIPSAGVNRCIDIVRALPNTTSNSFTNTNTHTNRCPNHQQRNHHFDPDPRPLIQTRHTSTHIMLVTLSPHSLLLHLHSILAWPNSTLWITALALEEGRIFGRLRSQGFNVRIVGGVNHIDVLLGFGFLRFEGIAGGSCIVEWRERGSFVVERFLIVRGLGGGEGVCRVDIFDCAQDVYGLV